VPNLNPEIVRANPDLVRKCLNRFWTCHSSTPKKYQKNCAFGAR
jgi:hypothetical protein